MTLLGFSGYAVLLPVAPLWAVHGGADTGQSGLVNGVLLLFTVLTQLFVPRSLRRFGWGPTLSVGMVMLGVPAALYAVSDALGPVLALSAARGVGFGVLTVTGSSAIAALVETERRGEAIGIYGLAVALPNLVLLPAGPWLAENVGFGVIFAISALPILAIPAALRLATALHLTAPDLLAVGGPADDPVDRDPTVYRRLLRPTVLLFSVTLAGGAVLTFAPQMVPGGLLATAGLLVLGLVGAISRWRAGKLADRYGAQPFVWPLVLLTGVGMALVAWSVSDPDSTKTLTFLAAMAVVGLAYGALQNLTLVMAFGAVSRRHHNLASAVWNIGFDAGTALGSVAVGAIAVQTSFSSAFWVIACLTVAVLPVALWPAAKVTRSPLRRE